MNKLIKLHLINFIKMAFLIVLSTFLYNYIRFNFNGFNDPSFQLKYGLRLGIIGGIMCSTYLSVSKPDKYENILEKYLVSRKQVFLIKIVYAICIILFSIGMEASFQGIFYGVKYKEYFYDFYKEYRFKYYFLLEVALFVTFYCISSLIACNKVVYKFVNIYYALIFGFCILSTLYLDNLCEYITSGKYLYFLIFVIVSLIVAPLLYLLGFFKCKEEHIYL